MIKLEHLLFLSQIQVKIVIKLADLVFEIVSVAEKKFDLHLIIDNYVVEEAQTQALASLKSTGISKPNTANLSST